MLRWLELKGVGPSPQLRLEFGERVNVLTGNNGLGKSFLLDLAWWALTRDWAGDAAWPRDDAKRASISYVVRGRGRRDAAVVTSEYRFLDQAWSAKAKRPPMPGLVVYARVDGGFSVWDPMRNYWREAPSMGISDPERPAAFHFDKDQVWEGLSLRGRRVCEGLIRDWVSWQKGNDREFSLLERALQTLSVPEEPLTIGRPIRVRIGDGFDTPTLVAPYGTVPVTLASAGIRRIAALAYLLVWTWREHHLAAQLLRRDAEERMVLLVDEPETHLHPKWQRLILPALLETIDGLRGAGGETQVLVATHSPLVLASMDTRVNPTKDVLIDLDLAPTERGAIVEAHRRPWNRRGDVNAWLTSEVFDLKEPRSREAEHVLTEAGRILSDPAASKTEALEVHERLRGVLGEMDPFWIRWRFIAEKRGWLE